MHDPSTHAPTGEVHRAAAACPSPAGCRPPGSPVPEEAQPPSARGGRLGNALRDGSVRRLAGAFFVLSLLLRLVAALPVLTQEVWPAWDEAGYTAKAEAFHSTFERWLAGKPTLPSDRDRAYGGGTWPPLHPLLAALAMLGGGGLTAARLLTLLLSAATTPLVFLLALRCAPRRSALLAALAHATYPSFLGFAHLLWSETPFVLLLLGTILAALRVAEATSPGRALGRCLAVGGLLGAAALTRAAVLPFIVCLPLFLAWKARGAARAWRPAAVLVAAGLVVAPWEWVLHQREGELVVLSSANGYNLLLGQFVGQPGESGRARKVRMNQLVRARAREAGTSTDQAARALAWELIREDPVATLKRARGRFSHLWGPDSHLIRHLMAAAYPPIPPLAALGVWLLLQVSYPTFVAAALTGLARRGPPLAHRGLLVSLVVAGMVPPLFSVSSTRMSVPLLALLLPAVGHGLSRLATPRGWRPLLVLASLVFAAELLDGPVLPASSSFYGPVQTLVSYPSSADRLGATGQRRVGDRLAVRLEDDLCDAPQLALRGAGAFFADGSRRLALAGERRVHLVRVYTTAPQVTPRLEVRCSGQALAAFSASPRAAWHRWVEVGGGVDVLWLGGAEVNPTPLDRQWPLNRRRGTAAAPRSSAPSATRTPASGR